MKVHIFIAFLLIGITFQQCSIGCLRCNKNNQCQLCDVSNGYYLNGNTCMLSQQTSCTLISQNDSCVQCSSNYYLDVNSQRCVAVGTSNVVSNCMNYNSGQICTSCSGNFFVSAGRCSAVNVTVTNCMSYTDNGVCSACSSGHVLSADFSSCVALPANDNCLSYTFINCRQCATGFVENQNLYFTSYSSPAYLHSNVLVNMVVPRTSWVALNVCQAVTVKNCAIYTAFNRCSQCNTGYYLTEGNCMLFPKPVIFGCLTYTDLMTCSVCQPGMFLSQNTCQNNVVIENCQTYSGSASVTTCMECSGEYYLQGNICVARSVSVSIENCATRSITADLCLTCNASFILTSDSRACVAAVTNCKTYSASTYQTQVHQCSLCEDGFYVSSSGSVTSCTAGTVQFCKVYTVNGNTCSMCQNGYYLSGTACLAHVTISNCATYDPTRKNFCSTCNSGYYNFAYTTVCEPGTIRTGCKKYSTSANECSECETGYYLSGGSCTTIPSTFTNCMNFSGNECTRCNDGYMVNSLPTTGTCVLPLDYISSSTNSPCSVLERFQATTTIAKWIDPILNGSTTSTIVCKTCNDYMYGYAPQKTEAICVLTSQLSLYSNFVTISQCKRYGLNFASSSSIVCMECNSGFYIDGYFAFGFTGTAYSSTNTEGINCVNSCTQDGGISSKIIIPDDYFGFVNICVQSTSSGSGPFIFSSGCKRYGRKTGANQSTPFPTSWSGSNALSHDYLCFLASDSSTAAGTSTPDNYLELVLGFEPDPFKFNRPDENVILDTLDDFTTAYSGVADKTSFAPTVFNFNGILGTIAPNTSPKSTKATSTLANCDIFASVAANNSDTNEVVGFAMVGLEAISGGNQYYVPMGEGLATARSGSGEINGILFKTTAGTTAVWCLRCNMGYELTHSPNNAAAKNWSQPSCVQMSNCASTTTVYGGLPTFLNSVFSCHYCSQSSGSATYPSIWIEIDGIGSQPTGQMINWMVEKVYTGINDVNSNHGFRCAAAPSKVRKSDSSSSSLADKDLGTVSNCAAYAYVQPITITGELSIIKTTPVDSFPSVHSGNTISTTAGVVSIEADAAGSDYENYAIPICVACSGKYFPTYLTTAGFTSITSGKAKVPAWTVTSCTAASNCNESTAQFNSCAGCNTNMETAATPEYYGFSDFTMSNCFRSVTQNCFILSSTGFASTSTTNACKICKAGYFMNGDGFCESYRVPNESSSTGKFYHSYYVSKAVNGSTITALNPIEVKLASLVGFNQLQYGVNACTSGWSLAPANLWAPEVCVFSSYIYNHTGTFPSTSKYVNNCIRYNVTATAGGNYICGGCSTGYIPTVDGTSCVSSTSIPNCVFAQNGSNNGLCYECLSTFRNVNGQCLSTTIPNCKSYVNNEWSFSTPGTLQCSACMDGFYLSNDSLTCSAGTVSNCIGYNQGSSTICNSCASGYVLLTLTSVYYCYPIPASLNCSQLQDTSTTSGANLATISCASCMTSTTAVYGTRVWNTLGRQDEAQTLCMPFSSVSNCLTYDQGNSIIVSNTFACTECANGFYYSATDKICKTRVNLPSQCSTYSKTADLCTTCTTGSFLSTDGKDCINFPKGIYQCNQYSGATTCTQCNTGYYLSNNACVTATNINNCMTYSSKDSCSACKSGFFLSNPTTCSPATATNCLTYSSITACASCAVGRGLQTTNGVTSCVLVTLTQCATATTIAPFSCLVCNSGYFPDANGVCMSVGQTISNCLVYDSATTCKTCASNSVLNVPRTVCNSTFYSSLVDPNCSQSFLSNTPSCAVCSLGSFFTNGTCVACSNNTLASGCLSCDPMKQDTCLACRPSYYMNDQGACVAVNPTPNPPTPEPTPNNVSILAKTFAFTFLLMAIFFDRQ